jgi:hypothetical protein
MEKEEKKHLLIKLQLQEFRKKASQLGLCKFDSNECKDILQSIGNIQPNPDPKHDNDSSTHTSISDNTIKPLVADRKKKPPKPIPPKQPVPDKLLEKKRSPEYRLRRNRYNQVVIDRLTDSNPYDPFSFDYFEGIQAIHSSLIPVSIGLIKKSQVNLLLKGCFQIITSLS